MYTDLIKFIRDLYGTQAFIPLQAPTFAQRDKDFAPLDGFMTRMDYESVLDRMRLSSGALWPLPICLDIHGTLAATLEAGQSVVLRDRKVHHYPGGGGPESAVAAEPPKIRIN